MPAWAARWSSREVLRFPSLQAQAEYHLPLFGPCQAFEYYFLLADAMLLIGAGAYLVARWLVRHSEG